MRNVTDWAFSEKQQREETSTYKNAEQNTNAKYITCSHGLLSDEVFFFYSFDASVEHNIETEWNEKIWD